MSFDLETLSGLVPAIHRIRDAEIAARLELLTAAERAELAALNAAAAGGGLDAAGSVRRVALADKAGTGPLRAFLTVLAEQIAALEADLDQLLDDQFIETCADWVVPYIGDLVGWRPVRTGAAGLEAARAEVADTIRLRRRKGTAAMLEQVARAVTGLDAAVVEYFRRLAVTQHLNHLRREVGTARLSTADEHAWRGGPFDRSARTAEVRRIASRRGRYNIHQLGVFLWRRQVLTLRRSPAVRVDARRFLFSPLGLDQPLLAAPDPQRDTRLPAGPGDVPAPLSRRRLAAELDDRYGLGGDLLVEVGGAGSAPWPLADLHVCCLADTGVDPNTSTWANMPAAGLALDPELGRLAFAADVAPGTEVRVSFRHAGTGWIGGGDYDRAETLEAGAAPVLVPRDRPTLAAALAAPGFGGTGVVEISGDLRFTGGAVPTAAGVAAQGRLEIRAANGAFPTLAPAGPIALHGGDGAELTLNGLRVDGGPLVVPALVDGQPNRLQVLRLRHCTLTPGGPFDRAGAPTRPGAPSLVVEAENVLVEIESCILGPVLATDEARLRLRDSIIDAGGTSAVAFAAPDGAGPGAPLWIREATVVGQVRTALLGLASNCLLLGAATASRRQDGILRFSYVAPGSAGPRRYACLPREGEPDDPARRPRFLSLRYGEADYGRLSPACTPALRAGADDGGEMGAFHGTGEAPREAVLVARLAESMPLGLEAGVFYAG